MPDAGGGFGVVGTVGVVVRGGGGGAGFAAALAAAAAAAAWRAVVAARSAAAACCCCCATRAASCRAASAAARMPACRASSSRRACSSAARPSCRAVSSATVVCWRPASCWVSASCWAASAAAPCAGGEGALGRFRGGGRRLFGGLGPALLGLAGRAVEGGGVEACRLGVGERLGALAADGLDAGRPVDHVLRAGAEEGVELGCAHALLVCVGGQEREQQVRVVGVGGGLVGGPSLLCGGLGGAFEGRLRAVSGHVGVGRRGLRLGDRRAGGLELGVQGAGLGRGVRLRGLGRGDLLGARSRPAVGGGGLGELGGQRQRAERAEQRAAHDDCARPTGRHGPRLERRRHRKNTGNRGLTRRANDTGVFPLLSGV